MKKIASKKTLEKASKRNFQDNCQLLPRRSRSKKTTLKGKQSGLRKSISHDFLLDSILLPKYLVPWALLGLVK